MRMRIASWTHAVCGSTSLYLSIGAHKHDPCSAWSGIRALCRAVRVFLHTSARADVGNWPWVALGEPMAGNAKKRWFQMRRSGPQATACWCWAPGLAPSPAGPHGRMQGQYVGVVGLQQRCGVVLGQGSVLAAVLPFVSRAPGGPPAGVPSSAVHHQ